MNVTVNDKVYRVTCESDIRALVSGVLSPLLIVTWLQKMNVEADIDALALSNGYDRDGYDRDGYDRDGYDKTYPAGYDRDGYDRNGYDVNGYDRDGRFSCE